MGDIRDMPPLLTERPYVSDLQLFQLGQLGQLAQLGIYEEPRLLPSKLPDWIKIVSSMMACIFSAVGLWIQCYICFPMGTKFSYYNALAYYSQTGLYSGISVLLSSACLVKAKNEVSVTEALRLLFALITSCFSFSTYCIAGRFQLLENMVTVYFVYWAYMKSLFLEVDWDYAATNTTMWFSICKPEVHYVKLEDNQDWLKAPMAVSVLYFLSSMMFIINHLTDYVRLSWVY